MFESIAYAAAPGGSANPLGAFIPLILIFVIFYFLLIRPQQKRQKQHRSMLDTLKAGDEIITNGGLYGRIVSMYEDNTLSLEISKGIKVKIVRSAVANKVALESEKIAK